MVLRHRPMVQRDMHMSMVLRHRPMVQRDMHISMVLRHRPRRAYISHLTSHIAHRTSHISHLTPHISHRTSHISHLTSYISHLTSHISHRTSHILHLAGLISHLTSYILHLTPRRAHRAGGGRSGQATSVTRPRPVYSSITWARPSRLFSRRGSSLTSGGPTRSVSRTLKACVASQHALNSCYVLGRVSTARPATPPTSRRGTSISPPRRSRSWPQRSSYSPTYLPTYLPTYVLTFSLIRSLTHSLHSLTHALTHSLTPIHSLTPLHSTPLHSTLLRSWLPRSSRLHRRRPCRTCSPFSASRPTRRSRRLSMTVTAYSAMAA